MNTLSKRSLFLLFLLSSCFFISANAQRGRSNGNDTRSSNSNSGRSGNFSNRSSSGDFNRQRSFDRSPGFTNNSSTSVDRTPSASVDRRSTVRPNIDNRIADRSNWNNQSSSFRRNTTTTDLNRNTTTNLNRDLSRSSSRTDFNSQRSNRTVIVNNTVNNYSYNRYPSTYNRYPTVYNYRNGGYSFSHYNYYAPRRYVYVGAPRYSILPRTFISINFGGYPYYYHGGGFYGYYGGYYEPVFAPIGIHIRILPVGYYPIYIGPTPYYYYEGVYYKKYQDRDEYEVVDAPMGAIVSKLPKGAKAAVVNGEKFYEFNGTYYKETTNNKNEVEYTVVGKNGNINNTEEPAAVTTLKTPQIDDEITALPENSKQVTINGEVLYVTPDNLYLKPETRNDTTTYKVVGKAETN
jgi:hypothetical protein